MVEAHQPGEAVFRSILPEEIDWKPFPAFRAEAINSTSGRSTIPPLPGRTHPHAATGPVGYVTSLPGPRSSRQSP